MHPSWRELLADEFKKPYFTKLVGFVREERKNSVVFPPPGDVFNALKLGFEDVRVCILGQDPYHNTGQAHGLSFSVPMGMKPPPSLLNIFKELEEDVPGFKRPGHGCLEAWAERGVLLLNATLTVRAHEPGSHQGEGWEDFTDAILGRLNERSKPAVFVLWGRYAQAKASLLDAAKHTIISSAHPSPMSASSGFFGSRPFSRCNQALEKFNMPPIDWRL